MPATGTNTNVTVNYNNGSPSISQSGAIDLNHGDTLTLQLSGFPTGASIDTISFYGNFYNEQRGQDQKDTNNPKGSWTRARGNGSDLTVYSCTGQTGGNAQIEDIECNDDDDKYWYGIQISGTGGPWDLDPELINKGSKGGG